jgi:4-amino-4-deoxy-L-arabinose transferase-like glycosyltransferase
MTDERSAPSAPAGRAFWPRVIVIAALGLLLRLFVVLTIPTQPVSDFNEYFVRAQKIARSGLQPEIEEPNANHPPLYPLWLAGIVSTGPQALLAVKLGNCLLGVATILVGSGLARRLWGFRAGIAAALLFAFLPRLLLMPLIVASENLFSPLLLLFMGAAARRWRLGAGAPSDRQRSVALPLAAEIGLLIGLLALTRTVAYFLALVWLVGVILARLRVKTILVELVVILAVQHLVMLPWAIRNERAVGRFTFLNTVGGVGLYAGNNPHATADWRPWQKDLERERPGILSQGSAEIDDAARQEAIRWIRKHPGRAARLYLKRLWLIFKQDTVAAWWAIYAKRITPPFPGRDVLSERHPLEDHRAAVFWALRIFDAFLLACAFGGLCLLFRRAQRSRSGLDRALAVGFLATVAYFPLLSAPIATNGRQRWPSEDLSVPIAAMFLTMKRGQATSLIAQSDVGFPASEENLPS